MTSKAASDAIGGPTRSAERLDYEKNIAPTLSGASVLDENTCSAIDDITFVEQNISAKSVEQRPELVAKSLQAVCCIFQSYSLPLAPTCI